MRDYAELVKALRYCGSPVTNEYNCNNCPWLSKCKEGTGENPLLKAADAIEELLAERDQYKAYFDNVSSLPDCNVCLKQSVCEFVPAWGENTRINCPLALTEPPKEG